MCYLLLHDVPVIDFDCGSKGVLISLQFYEDKLDGLRSEERYLYVISVFSKPEQRFRSPSEVEVLVACQT
jgi:hypothetical protein